MSCDALISEIAPGEISFTTPIVHKYIATRKKSTEMTVTPAGRCIGDKRHLSA